MKKKFFIVPILGSKKQSDKGSEVDLRDANLCNFEPL